ncbi:MAG: NUDIX hydrolase [Chloroflexi bacterium]|nr:NUDIX hydrolase [Chloroflexota bacterium]
MGDYITWIRAQVGHEQIFLNFAVACITNDEGQVLLQKRTVSGHTWGFPGGALEIGESAEQTVIREVQEETGLCVHVDSLIGVYTKYFDVYPNGDQAQTIVFFFQCSVLDGNLSMDRKETFDLTFFDPHDAPRLFNQQHRDMLADYVEQKRGVFR